MSAVSNISILSNSNSSDAPVDESYCKLILYLEIQNSSVRIWDLIILIPNVLFMLFLALRFHKAQLKLRATSSPIFLTFYFLVWGNVVISIVRCIVSMTVNAAVPLGGTADKVLWVTVRFFLLATEMSVVIFGLAFGHLDSRNSIRHVLLTTSCISLAFTITQGTLEIMLPDDAFYIETKDFWLFGHGGMVFWFCSSLIFAFIYLCILVLPWTRLRERLALPTKLSFYVYILVLVVLNGTQAVGAALLGWVGDNGGLCIVDVTTWLYFALYTPLLYHTFLSEFFRIAWLAVKVVGNAPDFKVVDKKPVAVSSVLVTNEPITNCTSQPSIMFSYKAQMDEVVDDDQVSLPHPQSFSSLKTDSDYIYQHSNSVYDSTVFETGGTTPANPLYSTSLQSPDSITSGQSLNIGGPTMGYRSQQHQQ